MQPLDLPHDTNIMRNEKYSVVTEEIVLHALRSFASQLAQGIIYFMNSLGTEDGFHSYSDNINEGTSLISAISTLIVCVLGHFKIQHVTMVSFAHARNSIKNHHIDEINFSKHMGFFKFRTVTNPILFCNVMNNNILLIYIYKNTLDNKSLVIFIN